MEIYNSAHVDDLHIYDIDLEFRRDRTSISKSEVESKASEDELQLLHGSVLNAFSP